MGSRCVMARSAMCWRWAMYTVFSMKITPSTRERFMARNAASSSPGLRTLTVCVAIPSRLAACSASRTARTGPRLSRSLRMATREARGTSCLRSSKRLPPSSLVIEVTPVTFPPGRASVPAICRCTGSPPVAVTMGMVVVACLVARAASLPAVTIMSILASTSSTARLRSWLTCPSPHRDSKRTFCPCTYPSSWSRSRSAFHRLLVAGSEA
jgi:hypothetical protein